MCGYEMTTEKIYYKEKIYLQQEMMETTKSFLHGLKAIYTKCNIIFSCSFVVNVVVLILNATHLTIRI